MAGRGRSWSLTTSYDIAFLHAVLAALEQAPLQSAPCTAWPLRTVRLRQLSQRTQNWLASVNLLLLEAKCADDVADGAAWKGRIGLHLLTSEARRARLTLGQSGFPVHLLTELPREQSKMERAALPSLDLLALPTARALGEVFAHAAVLTGREEFRSLLRRLGYGLGAALYLRDALDDWDSDRKKGRFNALSATHHTPNQAKAFLEREVARTVRTLEQLKIPSLDQLEPLITQLLPPQAPTEEPWRRARRRQKKAGVCECLICCGVEVAVHACCLGVCNGHSHCSGSDDRGPKGDAGLTISPKGQTPHRSNLACPACDFPMVATDASGLEYDDCQRCGGLWLDKGELQALARAQRLPHQLAHRRVGKHAPPPREEGTRLCPRCAELLSVMTVRSVRLDFCSVCQGLFLDAGELSQFLNSEASSQDS